jgi:exonuclease SbcC
VSARDAADDSVRQSGAVLAAVESAWVEGQAGLLARSLRQDEACPVCGSVEHPQPAAGRHDVPERAEVDAARAAMTEARDRNVSAAENVAAARAELAGLEATIASLSEPENRADAAEGRSEGQRQSGRAAVEGCQDDGSAEPRHTASRATLQGCRRVLAAAEAGMRQAESAVSRLATLSAQLAALRGELAAHLASSKSAAEELQRLERESAAQSGAVEQLERVVPDGLRTPDALTAAIARTRAALSLLTAAFDAAQTCSDAAARARIVAEQALTGARQRVDVASTRAGQSRARFLAAITDAGFASEDDYRSARLAPSRLDALSEEVKRFGEQLASARDRASRARETSPSTDLPDLASLDARVSALDAAVQDRSRAQGEAVERLRRTASTIDALAALALRRQAATAEFGCVTHVSNVVNGQNRLGVTLQRYVLGALLDEVLVAASQRLRTMTRGRFDLQRDRTREDARRAGGLELVVLDGHTGTLRPVNTLSGGEGFVASLALALGLADVVQSYAAGIRLDTIFVDEGFGSLDDEALDLALQTLMQLREGGRLVGIISHVAELRNRIDARLEVIPTAKGSTARFVM